MRTFRRAVVVLTAAATVTVVGAGPASAGTLTVRNDDGSREAGIRIDEYDDHATKRLEVRAETLAAASSATLWMYGTAENCAAPDTGLRVLVNNTLVATVDPCATWPTGEYGWASLPLPMSAVSSTGIWLEPRWSYPAPKGRGATFGVDTSTTGDTMFSREAGVVRGRLMWHLEFHGSSPALVAPTTTSYGLVPVGTPSARAVPVTNLGTAQAQVSSLAMSGTAAAEYAVTSDGCTGVWLEPGDTCEVGVTFTPAAKGTRPATLVVSGIGGSASAALTGEGRSDPPVSAFTTPGGATILRTEAVTGTVTDDLGVTAELVTVVPDVGTYDSAMTSAPLTCDAARTACTWSLSVRLLHPGWHTVTAYGRDVQGIAETPGPGIRVLVI